MIKKIWSMLLLLFLAHVGFAQQDDHPIRFEVGKPFPDFLLHNITHYPKKQATLADFRGKWLVLDFWNKGCGACVASFPRTNAMQKQFAGKVQFMLVGVQDKDLQIEPMYEKYRRAEHLILPCAFDSTIANRFGITTVPHLFIIDDKGIIRGVTNGLTADAMQSLLAGGHPYLRPTYTGDSALDYRLPYDPRKPFLIGGNGGADTDFLFRSVLAKYDPHKLRLVVPMSIDPHSIDPTYRQGRFYAIGAPITWLYSFAFLGKGLPEGSQDTSFGKIYHYPILETRDSSIFNFQNGDNLYSYSLTIPPSMGTRQRLQNIMKRDLQNYFGLDVSLQTREVPCYALVLLNKNAGRKLSTKGGPPRFTTLIPRASFSFQNKPVAILLNMIEGVTKYLPVFDETGIKGNIDITIDNGVNFLNFRKSLQENGLDIIPIKRKMKALVFRDPKPDQN